MTMRFADTFDVSELLEKIRQGDRIALSRAITLVESRQQDHITIANALLDGCMHNAQSPAMRLGVSGAPGVGKSTFIEAISQYILDEGHTLAVLAVDPSSQVTGGSILGDKTRMSTLAAHPNAFVRPTPAAAHQGGVAERTREVIMLCEAAGFDIILVETVGVGQSEMQVRSMTDVLLLLIAPGGGDEVQGIKRGILEVADLVVVNKADGDLEKKSRETAAQYAQALRVLYAGNRKPDVLTCSALTGSKIDLVWKALHTHFQELQQHGALEALRRQQDLTWFEERLKQDILQRCMMHPEIGEEYRRNRELIASQNISVRSALADMQQIVDHVLKFSGYSA